MSANTPSTIVLQEAAGLLARATALLTTLAARRSTPPTAPPVPPLASPAPATTAATATTAAAYLTTKEAAALLGISAKGLEAMRARGGGPPFVRVGKLVRYPSATLGR